MPSRFEAIHYQDGHRYAPLEAIHVAIGEIFLPLTGSTSDSRRRFCAAGFPRWRAGVFFRS